MNRTNSLIRLLAGVCGGILMSGGVLPQAAQAQSDRPSLADSFRIGSGGGALCQAQSSAKDAAVVGMYDRAWTLVCRDSALPVGQLYALRAHAGESEAQLLDRTAKSRAAGFACSAAGGGTLADVGTVSIRNCAASDGLTYRIATARKGRTTYIVQGIAGYTSALDLALRTIVADRMIDGKVEIATIGNADNAAFARLQARALDPQTVLAEGYRRNNSGNYAEAAEFFDSLSDRLSEESAANAAKLTEGQRVNRAHEYMVNRALQLSNLGEFDAASALFRKARGLRTVDPVQVRLARNFGAMHLLNQRSFVAALALLDQPLANDERLDDAATGVVEIGPRIAAEMNSGKAGSQSMGVRQETKLTSEERMAIIDAQGQQLRGTALRLTGKPAEARVIMTRALADASAIRDGRVTSITRLRAQLLGEIALTHEAENNFGEAEALLRQGVDLLAAQYPETVAMNGARARLGAFLVRRGRTDDALAIYRTVIASTVTNRNALTGLNNQLAPYFTLLADAIPARPELTDDLFAATQVLMRPGSADTLETLTRELSAGDSDAARLFRQSVSLSRDIERARISLAQLAQAQARDPSVKPLIAAQQADIESLSADQAKTLAALAAYPQYRAVSKDVLTLADLSAALKPGEAYLKLAQVSGALYAVYADSSGATGYKVALTGNELEDMVAKLRATISASVNGTATTYALDVATARALYIALLGPIDARLKSAQHVIFEPDGAMLQLPLNLLIASQEGADAYKARVAKGGDEFDFRGIDWVGRSHSVSTALSARAFRDARQAAASSASREYIGFGENAPITKMRQTALTRAGGQSQNIDCSWPVAQWSQPISAAELRSAAQNIGTDKSTLVTGAAFTDDGLLARGDLADYRILHFATHGLVTAPRRECPAQPALITSFGAAGKSDGLLQFSEVFDLKLDADLVILSACDTAGKASAEATRAAGLGSGGGAALDGLVRAFIGAGGRSVIASHWPAPDEFNATGRLIEGLFAAGSGVSVADALHAGQLKLMDEADTSHPFYWAGFSIIGDGARPVLASR